MSASQLLAAELEALLGPRLSRSVSDRETHRTGVIPFAVPLPEAVAYPLQTAEVARIAALCSEHGCPLTAWGAGTSLEGHALPLQGGISLDFSRMDRVLDIHAADMLAVVQPGVTREALDTALRATGLFFPVDPGANATLGGMASTRASGTTAVRYGTMRDNVRALEVVLADGRIIRTGTRAAKSSTGYDLTGLFVGSEGTLGLITELTLRLHGRPEAVAAATCAFPDMHAAVAAVIETIQAGIPMARIEFVDDLTAAAFNAHAGTDFAPLPHLLLEFHGSNVGVAENSRAFVEIATAHGALQAKWATSEDERRALWRLRHNGYFAFIARYPDRAMITTDTCVPISHLAQAVAETAADVRESGIPGPILGHVGDGNFHTLLLPRKDSQADYAIARELATRMAERALRLGGTVSGEHGIGMGKLRFMDLEHGPALGVMRQLKDALDPRGVLNPGKLVAAR
jgi:D-lactate dehydrogenase (cytochrome)